MEIKTTPLKDCYLIHSKKFGDDRGFFLEAFNQKKLKEGGVNFDVRQINFAKSSRNVLRGLHFQTGEYAQTKMVGVIQGAVLDVVIDLRKDSPTYLQHYKVKINTQDLFLLVPRGFAHGYYTLEDDTIFHYAVDNFYAPDHEGGVRWNDPAFGIDWELNGNTPKVSEKDQLLPFAEKL